jgi:PAS domain S-box-containing protein
MSGATHPECTNDLIASLPPEQRERFLAHATHVVLQPNKVLQQQAEQPIQDVYFPLTAVLSVLSVTGNGIAVETAVIGREGMASLAAFHQATFSAEQTIVQVPGTALRMTREAFHAALAAVPAMRSLLHRFSQALFTFTAQSSACNRQHSVVQRCARWLLMTRDRVPGDEFYLTHLFLSQMLGVRRSSVTVAAEVLRAAGAIAYTRGKVRVLDRDILLSRSCECYAIIRSSYDRLLAGRDTPSPLQSVALSDGEESLALGGSPRDQRPSPPGGVAAIPDEELLAEFSGRLRDARQRGDALRGLVEGRAHPDDEHVLRLTDELSMALEQLSVAEEEMRVQMEALAEMRTALEAQHQAWQSRFDGLPDAYIETDQDDTIIELNRAAEDLIGRPRRSMLGKPLPSLFPDTDRRGLRDVIGALRRGNPTAHWSGTVIAATRLRPAVDVAVAATRASSAPASAVTAASNRYVGARWLLRRTGAEPPTKPA